jgi:glycosyltransferase involved in cell wall biosynthesis
MRREVIGLTRHSGTEPPGSSTATAFDAIEQALKQRFRVVRLPFYWPQLPKQSLRSLLRDYLQRCDAILDSPGYPNLQLLQFRQELQLPRPMIWLDLGSVARGAVRLRESAEYLTERDQLLFTSTSDRDIALSLFSRLAPPCDVVPLCVDRNFRSMRPGTRARTRRHLQISDDAVVFLYTGRITSEKNIHAMLLTLAKVLSECHTAVAMFVGPIGDLPSPAFGSTLQDLGALFQRFLADHPAIASRIRFHPPVNRSELPLVYNIADVFVNLTLHGDENFGFSQVEAMACGLPVVGSDWGGLRNTIEHGKTGFLVHTRMNAWGVRVDIAQAADYCLALARSAILRSQLGTCGQQLARSRYSPKALATTLCSCVRAVLRRKHPSNSRGSRLSQFGRQFHRAFSDSSGVPTPPRYTDSNYHLYRKLMRSYVTGPARQWGPVVCVAPWALELQGRILKTVDPLWSKSFRIDRHEHRLVGRLQAGLQRGSRFVFVDELVRGLNHQTARRALQTLTAKGILIGGTGETA